MMTMEAFEKEKARLLALYGSASRDAMQKRAQAFARLYAQSGWTQMALAAVEHMALGRINQLVTFGRFIIFTNCENGTECTEGHFRALWRRTDKTAGETARFAAVAQMIEESRKAQTPQPCASRHLGKTIVAHFADGKWRRVSEIAADLEQDPKVVKDMLDRIVTQGLYKTFAERRPGAKGSVSYRLVKGGAKKINLAAFYAECQPVLDDMEKTINGHSVHFSQTAMKMAFTQFRQVIERLAR